MNYNDFSELCRAKRILIKDVLPQIGYTRQGLQAALNNETIELRKLKLLCDSVRISPSYFFEPGTFGTVINAGGHVQSGNNNRMEVESLDRENAMLRQQVEQLRSQLADKEEIIRLMKGKQ